MCELNAPAMERPSDTQDPTGNHVLVVSPGSATPFAPTAPTHRWFAWVTSSTVVAITTIACQIVRALAAIYTPRPAMS